MTLAQPSPPRFALDLKPTTGLYLAVGLEAGGDRAANLHHAHLLGRNWAHFGRWW